MGFCAKNKSGVGGVYGDRLCGNNIPSTCGAKYIEGQIYEIQNRLVEIPNHLYKYKARCTIYKMQNAHLAKSRRDLISRPLFHLHLATFIKRSTGLLHTSGVKDFISGETDARSIITRTKVFVSG